MHILILIISAGVDLKRVTYLEAISDAIALPPDVLAGAPILYIQGRTSLLLENYKKILEYTSSNIQIQTQLYSVSIEGDDLSISYYTKDEMKVNGIFRSISFQ